MPAELGALPWIAAVVLGLTLAGAAAGFGEDYAWTWAGERFLLDLRTTFFSHIQRLSFDTLDTRRLGDLIARMGRRRPGDRGLRPGRAASEAPPFLPRHAPTSPGSPAMPRVRSAGAAAA